MLKRFMACALVAALLCTLSGTQAFAQSKSLPDAQASETSNAPAPAFADRKEAQAGLSLKADIQKLVADARAGRGVALTDPQNQPRQSNSLSKSVKIGLIVGVALAVVLIIVFIHQRDHLFDDFSLGN